MHWIKNPPLLAFLAVLFFSLTAFAQPCPGFQNGNPANHLYTVDFYDINGNLIASCECQLTGNAFKCGSCLPSSSSFLTYQFVSGGTTVNCVNAAVLPVELTRFEALVTAGNVQISWATASERDNAKFILERSADGFTYEPFIEIEGAGTSMTEQFYLTEDNDPINGLSYYRLSQVDLDGTMTGLSVVAVETNTILTDIVLAPNPSNGTSMLHLPLHNGTKEFQVIVSDYSGKIVREETVTEDFSLDLPAGFYQVMVLSGSQRWSEKLSVL